MKTLHLKYVKIIAKLISGLVFFTKFKSGVLKFFLQSLKGSLKFFFKKFKKGVLRFFSFFDLQT